MLIASHPSAPLLDSPLYSPMHLSAWPVASGHKNVRRNDNGAEIMGVDVLNSAHLFASYALKDWIVVTSGCRYSTQFGSDTNFPPRFALTS